MKTLKCYPTYQGSLDAERHREKQWRSTKQGAFESSFVSFEETKEAFYPLGAAVSRPFHQDPEKARRAYKSAHKLVSRKAPHCLEVLGLILKNGSNRQMSICEMIEKLKAKKRVLKIPMKNSTALKKESTIYTGKRSKGS